MKERWQDQVAVGRVFELRSRSTKYPPTCVLVIREDGGWGEEMVVKVDHRGVCGRGLYRRSGNPAINTYGLKRADFTSRRIARRRPDLERFDANDIDLIRYGVSVDFTGRLGADEGLSYDHSLPTTMPAIWTIFWTRSEHWSFDYPHSDRLNELMAGAWHFEKHAPEFWRYGWCHVWATAHECGNRLRRIERLLHRTYPDLERQTVRIVRWHDWLTLRTHTWPVGNAGPAFRGTWHQVDTPRGSCSAYWS